VPEGRPFPNKNDRKSFKRLITLLRILNWLLPLLVAGAAMMIMLALL